MDIISRILLSLAKAHIVLENTETFLFELANSQKCNGDGEINLLETETLFLLTFTQMLNRNENISIYPELRPFEAVCHFCLSLVFTNQTTTIIQLCTIK